MLQVASAAASWQPGRRRRHETRLAAASSRPLTRLATRWQGFTCSLGSLPPALILLSIATRTGRDACAQRVVCDVAAENAVYCPVSHLIVPRRAVKRHSYPRHIDAPSAQRQVHQPRPMADTKAAANDFAVVIAIDASQQAEYAIKCEYTSGMHACVRACRARSGRAP